MTVLDRLAPTPEMLMEEAIGDARTVLDVGCGPNSPISRFRRRYDRTVGVDLFEPALEASAAAGIHDEYMQLDITRLDEAFGPDSFDAVVAFDVIEHLDKGDARLLLATMETVARRRVVVHTPNGFIPQDEYDGNPLQEHRSGWTPRELRDLRYSVRGSNGWRALRGKEGQPRWRPVRLWGVLARLSQPLVHRRPELAYQLLCVKQVG